MQNGRVRTSRQVLYDDQYVVWGGAGWNPAISKETRTVAVVVLHKHYREKLTDPLHICGGKGCCNSFAWFNRVQSDSNVPKCHMYYGILWHHLPAFIACYFNQAKAPLSMIQFNLEAVVPFFVSSEGYGLLWDNYAWTYLNPPVAENALAGVLSCCALVGWISHSK